MKKLLSLTVLAIVFFSCSKEANDAYDAKFYSLKVGYHFDNIIQGKVPDFGPKYYGENVNDQKNDAEPTNLVLVDGKFGNAISFENTTSSLRIPYGFKRFTKQFVIDFWINLKAQPTADYRNLISETMAGHANTFRIGVEDNYISFDFVKNPDITEGVKSSFKLEEDIWYHIAFTYDGLTLKLFIDGDFNAGKIILVGVIDSWNSLKMGYYNDYYGSALTFYGKIDEFRVWDYNFSDNDVRDYLMTTHQF